MVSHGYGVMFESLSCGGLKFREDMYAGMYSGLRGKADMG